MKKFFALVLSIVMICSLAACGSSSKKSDSDVDYIKEKGTLIVGITNFAPMDYPDASGNWIGFDADMARIVADKLGVKIEFVEIDWDNKILEINNKSIDCVWNGMTLSDEVTKAMTCTKAYCNNAQVIVTKADFSGDITAYAVETGSAGEEVAQDKGWNTNSVDTQARALMEVQSGTSDAAIIDLLMAGAMIGEGTDYPNLIYTDALTSEEYGVGCRQGSDLADFINTVFADTYKDGTMLETAKIYGVQEALIAQ